MIDLHSHVLPNVDDGAPSSDDALDMLRIAAADGVRTIVATPHIPPRPGETLSPEEIFGRIDELSKLARDAAIAVDILAGSEIRLEPSVVHGLLQGDLLTINGSPYVLVELPLVGDWQDHVRSTIYEMQIGGFIPILAHVERYPSVQQDVTLLADLIATGVLMQVNADSITSVNRGRHSVTARRLIDARMVHVIASDAHSIRSRPPKIRAAYQRVAESTDEEYARWIEEAGAAVLSGDVVVAPEPRDFPRRHWWTRVVPRLGSPGR
jgi:protein-tyrosine phosphatase